MPKTERAGPTVLTLNVLKPGGNNLTVRVFLRAADARGDFEYVKSQ